MAVMRNGLEKMLNTNSAAIALQEFETFRTKQGEFSSDIARRMTIDRKTSPAAWWATFGGRYTSVAKGRPTLVVAVCSL